MRATKRLPAKPAVQTDWRGLPAELVPELDAAIKLMQQGRGEQADVAVAALLKKRPESGLICLRLAQNLFATGHAGDSELYADAANGLLRRTAVNLRELSELRFRLGAPAKAQALRREAEEIELAESCSARAKACLEDPALPLAEVLLDMARLAPRYKHMVQSLAEGLHERERYAEAQNAWKTFELLAPETGNATYLAGATDFALGHYEEATAKLMAFFHSRREGHSFVPLLCDHHTPYVLRFSSLREHCAKTGSTYHDFTVEQFAERLSAPLGYPAVCPTPEISVSPIELGVGVVEQAECLGKFGNITSCDTQIIYGKAVHPRYQRGWISNDTGYIHGNNTLVMVPQVESVRLAAALHLGGRAGANYFHWLTEELPRFFLAEEFGYGGIDPVIVLKGMPPQNLEAMRLVIGERQAVFMDVFARLRVDRLVVPTLTARIPNGSGLLPHEYAVSDWAIKRLRARIFEQVARLGPPDREYPRRIFMRRNRRVRGLVNEAEIAELFAAHGFVGVDPGELSFVQQVQMFSQAEMIAGTAGAAFTNLMFAPQDCKVFCLFKAFQGNPYYFHSIARALDQRLVFIVGQEVRDAKQIAAHYDFRIEPRSVHHVLERLLRADLPFIPQSLEP